MSDEKFPKLVFADADYNDLSKKPKPQQQNQTPRIYCRYHPIFQNPLSFVEYELVKKEFRTSNYRRQWSVLKVEEKREIIFLRIIEAVGSDPYRIDEFVKKILDKKPELFAKLLEKLIPAEKQLPAGGTGEKVFAPIIINKIPDSFLQQQQQQLIPQQQILEGVVVK